MSEEVVAIKGMLYVHTIVQQYSRPVIVHLYYPTGAEERWRPDMVGQQLKYRGYGGLYIGEHATMLALCDGGDTLPDPAYTREEPIPPPRGKKVRYYAGRWERYSAARGWESA